MNDSTEVSAKKHDKQNDYDIETGNCGSFMHAFNIGKRLIT
jgi:hypothetical protein